MSMENIPAGKLYKKFGFKDAGKAKDGELIMTYKSI
jgi:RimJ/RimL family protein N-acetyltransferase